MKIDILSIQTQIKNIYSSIFSTLNNILDRKCDDIKIDIRAIVTHLKEANDKRIL